MRRVAGYIGVVLIIAVVGLAVMAYFVRSFDPVAQVAHDGLGRTLSPAPWFMRFFFGSDPEWAGGIWFLIDMVAFWGGILIGGFLAQFGFKK